MTGGDPPSLRPGSKGFCAEVNLRRLLPSIAVLSRWPPPAPVASGTVMIAAHSQAGESPLSPNGLREAHLTAVGKAARGLPRSTRSVVPRPSRAVSRG